MSKAHKGKQLSSEHKKKIGERIKNLGIKPPPYKGEQHYAWKGGITPVAEKIRKCSAYRQWRMSVFKKHNFTCQKCGEREVVIWKRIIIPQDLL